jgi:hypothetical protein
LIFFVSDVRRFFCWAVGSSCFKMRPRRCFFVCLIWALVIAAGSVRAQQGSCQQVWQQRTVIIGGIGDSGTRGIRHLLELCGLRVCQAHSNSGDDDGIQRATHRLLYDSTGGIFPFIDARKHQGGSSKNGTASFHASDPLYEAFAQDLVSHPGWIVPPSHRTILCDAMARSFTCARKSASHADPRILSRSWPGQTARRKAKTKEKSSTLLWGFKEPRNALLLPEFASALGSNGKFVHVVRDGRDVAFSELRAVTSILCATWFGGYRVDSQLGGVRGQALKNTGAVGAACAREGRQQIIAWAILNLAIFREASRSFGKRYLTIRIEDIALVENPIPAIEAVLNFLEIGGNDDVDDRSSSNRGAGIGGRRGVAHAIAERVKGRHAAAYGGNKFTPALRAVRLVELFGNESRSGRDGEVAKRGESSVLRALRHFGYRTDDWGIM